MSAIKGNAVRDLLGGGRHQSEESIRHRLATREGREPKLTELRQQAKERDVKYWYRLTKSELMELL